jgi:hypothetical protein
MLLQRRRFVPRSGWSNSPELPASNNHPIMPRSERNALTGEPEWMICAPGGRAGWLAHEAMAGIRRGIAGGSKTACPGSCVQVTPGGAAGRRPACCQLSL